VTVDLPALDDAAGIARVLGVLVEAVVAGELSPDEGQAVAGILETQRRAIETAEHLSGAAGGNASLMSL
jgi:hypothetical protein